MAPAGFGVNEIIATIMLNFVALYAVAYLARGPLRDPTATSHRAPGSRP